MTDRQNKWMLLIILALAAGAVFVTFTPKIRTWYGLDIQGGMRLVLRAKTEEYKGGRWESSNLDSARKVIENRVNGTGVAEPVMITKPPDQIVVELPGLKNEEEAVRRLQSTASLEFYLLPQLGSSDGSRPASWYVREQTGPHGEKEETLYDSASNQQLSAEVLNAKVFSNTDLLVVTGKNLVNNSRAVINPSSGQPVIEFEFDREGSDKFGLATRANIGRHLAIFLDKKLLTAPVINGPIDGKGIIEGKFTLETAKALSDLLNAGALPVPLELIETRRLEATLGREAVAQTTRAGVIGLALVLVFMLLYYRLPGLLADVALLLYTVFSLALFKLWPITLTLPGIAGFILSIGMAVDANILIFERLKEELRSGKTLRAAIDAGFKRAFTAIFDSNVCTIITCFVLYNFGTGPIRGFALTLGLGVAVSMFTAITVSRTFLFALVGMSGAQNPAAYGLSLHWVPNLRVMSRKFLWLGLSGAIIVPGLIAWAMGGIKPSIDFRGGTELTIPFSTRHPAEQVQSSLTKLSSKYKDSRVVVSPDLTYVTTVTLKDDERVQLVDTLMREVGPLAPGRSVGYSNVSGVISKELSWNAVQAVVVASLLIVLYLAIRFAIGGFLEGLKYGTCAVIALLHDVLVVWGAFAILGYLLNWQIDSLFVTAMLTVIGFSVHDTIIVFDRIRENLQNRARGETFSDLADRSINQTFARSVNTSFTVVLTLVALFIAGGSVIHLFVAALLIGIVSGTYSSIFNASVLLVMWKLRDAVALTPAYAGAPGRSGLGQRKAAPGDRPLVSPPPSEAAISGGAAGESPDESDKSAAQRAVPRRQPVRRRRM